jgi:hypothetical protein
MEGFKKIGGDLKTRFCTCFTFCSGILTFEQAGIKLSKSPVEVQPENLLIPYSQNILGESNRFGKSIESPCFKNVIYT